MRASPIAGAGSRRSASSQRIARGSSTNSPGIASSPARPSCWIPAAARSTIPSRSAARFRGLGALTTVGATVRTQTAQGERAQRGAGSLLRVDVRVPAAVGQDALRAAGRACPRAPDLDGRSRRRRQGRKLHRAGPDDRGARHRPSRQIHLRHGRHRRSAVARAQRAAVGRSARIVARRIAADQSRHDRCGRRRVPAGQCVGADGRSEAFQAAGSLRQFRRRGRRATAAGASRPRPPKPRFRPAAPRPRRLSRSRSKFRQPTVSSSAKADDPVRRGVCDRSRFPGVLDARLRGHDDGMLGAAPYA